MTKRFEDLEVFKKAYKISLELHAASLQYPKLEQYALADQLRRSSKGICVNIAEGFGKQASKVEFRRFVQMSIGSADETRVWLRYSVDLGYIDQASWKRWRDEYEEIAKMLVGLSKTLA